MPASLLRRFTFEIALLVPNTLSNSGANSGLHDVENVTEHALRSDLFQLVSQVALQEVHIVHHAFVAIRIRTSNFHVEFVELVEVQHCVTTVQSENALIVFARNKQHRTFAVVRHELLDGHICDKRRAFIDSLLAYGCGVSTQSRLRFDCIRSKVGRTFVLDGRRGSHPFVSSRFFVMMLRAQMCLIHVYITAAGHVSVTEPTCHLCSLRKEIGLSFETFDFKSKRNFYNDSCLY